MKFVFYPSTKEDVAEVLQLYRKLSNLPEVETIQENILEEVLPIVKKQIGRPRKHNIITEPKRKVGRPLGSKKKVESPK